MLKDLGLDLDFWRRKKSIPGIPGFPLAVACGKIWNKKQMAKRVGARWAFSLKPSNGPGWALNDQPLSEDPTIWDYRRKGRGAPSSHDHSRRFCSAPLLDGPVLNRF
jgi:hypothetical protein